MSARGSRIPNTTASTYARRIVDCGHKGERGQLAYAWGGGPSGLSSRLVQMNQPLPKKGSHDGHHRIEIAVELVAQTIRDGPKARAVAAIRPARTIEMTAVDISVVMSAKPPARPR